VSGESTENRGASTADLGVKSNISYGKSDKEKDIPVKDQNYETSSVLVKGGDGTVCRREVWGINDWIENSGYTPKKHRGGYEMPKEGTSNKKEVGATKWEEVEGTLTTLGLEADYSKGIVRFRQKL